MWIRRSMSSQTEAAKKAKSCTYCSLEVTSDCTCGQLGTLQYVHECKAHTMRKTTILKQFGFGFGNVDFRV